MTNLLKSSKRGRTRLDWLESRHSFSFGHHYDPSRTRFGDLRVLNEDWIAPGTGFGPHPHRDMEILTYPLAGTLEHGDSTGHVSRLVPGRVQLMRAGRGIVHSEVNPSETQTLHLLQIWIEPERRGLAPGHWEQHFELPYAELTPIATPGGRAGGLALAQDASLLATRLRAGEELVHPIGEGRHAWLQWVRGAGRVGDLPVEAGDGVAISNRGEVVLRADRESEALLFDLRSAGRLRRRAAGRARTPGVRACKSSK